MKSIHGFDKLVEMRKTGWCPADPITITYDANRKNVDWWKWKETEFAPEFIVRPNHDISRIDWRPLIGLDLVLTSAAWGSHFAELVEKLKEYATGIHVLVASFETDIGFFWSPRNGQEDLQDEREAA